MVRQTFDVAEGFWLRELPCHGQHRRHDQGRKERLSFQLDKALLRVCKYY
jgi:hypothetical protein